MSEDLDDVDGRAATTRLASAVPEGYEVPADVHEIAGPDPVPIWLNQAGGLTVKFESEPPPGASAISFPGMGSAAPRVRFLKRNPLPNSEDLELEARKLEWLHGRHPAPKVVEHFRRRTDGGEVEYLVTEALPGTNAVDPKNAAEAGRTIVEIAEGLRALHSLPVDDCPWTWSVEERLGLTVAEAGVSAGPASEAAAGPERGLGPTPEIDRLVVCHGDPCAPNTLLGAGGRFLGHVDLQRLGVADRWADLAVATMSFGWNYANYDESLFWETYGVEPDTERIRYYRELWNAE
ncbi:MULTISPECIES: aminoglycoside 3'-phosphotransferase [unclassified Brevibacterium]|uniref:aminoglycoside 3'-phosphotransferase n=1 Tax=unclassified Brevibacterium TaxID=2614124 RepID=UPI001E2D9AD6|nr:MULTISPECIES: aminoglycoside 3'-phosphotransferase [unclassified Brevibacterium]MCD1285257.1 aminoglycoside phosphotransferase APH(3') [Brevibacterium sp. CCUG 69071]MDK8434302.1 aminoglycoside 3'-phosphotransferase [Brevibacterium sp. H-BE7]